MQLAYALQQLVRERVATTNGPAAIGAGPQRAFKMLTIPDLTLLFMVVVSSLAVALIYMLHELEPKLARLRLRGNRVLRDRSK